MCAPSPPPAPDYRGAAQEQGEANLEAGLQTSILSNPNIITPYGTQTVTYGNQQGQSTPTADSGGYQSNNGRYDYYDNGSDDGYYGGYTAPRTQSSLFDLQPTVTQTFSPEQQRLYDQQTELSSNLNQSAIDGLGRVGDMMGSGFDTSGFGDVSSIDPSGYQDFSNIDTSGLPTPSLNTDGLTDFSGINTDLLPENAALSTQNLPDINRVNTGNLDPRTVQGSAGGVDEVYNALMNRESSRFSDNRSQTEADLIARGFNPGGSGYDARIDEINRAENDFSLGARAFAGQEQSRLFDLESQGRAQGLDEQSTQQAADQSLRGQTFGEDQAVADFTQRLRAQGFDEQAIQAQLNAAIRGQQFGERKDLATFEQSLRAQGFDEQAVQAQLNAAIRSQQLGEDITLQSSQATERDRAIQEALMLRQLPLNEINALRTGNQSTLPNFQQFAGSNVQAAPIMDATMAAGNFAQQNYQNQVAGSGGLFDLAGAVAGGPMGAALMGGIGGKK